MVYLIEQENGVVDVVASYITIWKIDEKGYWKYIKNDIPPDELGDSIISKQVIYMDDVINTKNTKPKPSPTPKPQEVYWSKTANRWMPDKT